MTAFSSLKIVGGLLPADLLGRDVRRRPAGARAPGRRPTA